MYIIQYRNQPVLSINVKHTLIAGSKSLYNRTRVCVDGQTERVDGKTGNRHTEPSVGGVILWLMVLVMV